MDSPSPLMEPLQFGSTRRWWLLAIVVTMAACVVFALGNQSSIEQTERHDLPPPEWWQVAIAAVAGLVFGVYFAKFLDHSVDIEAIES